MSTALEPNLPPDAEARGRQWIKLTKVPGTWPVSLRALERAIAEGQLRVYYFAGGAAGPAGGGRVRYVRIEDVDALFEEDAF